VEKIYQHIEKLLAQHDYVVVPNLGGFVVQTQSAMFFSDHITPPQSSIGFNPLMHHSDGLLAIEIARTEGISYRAAIEAIDSEIDIIKKRLHKRIGKYSFYSKTKSRFFTNQFWDFGYLRFKDY
jgi:CCDC81-like prokaryotic HU domain 1